MQKRILIFAMALIALFSVSLNALAEAMVVSLHAGDRVEINCNGNKLNLTRLNVTKIKAECNGASSNPTNSSPQNLNLAGGDSVEISCDGSKLSLTRLSKTKANTECKGSAPAPTNTPVPLPTNTPTPPPTDTPPDELAGKECPAWVHDRHVVQGPDGKMYPTWHPQIDPQYGCYFNHEHGDDPTTSVANSTLPAFGYIGSQGGFDEPHAGFKVFVTNAGFTNEEGRTALDSSRVVAHMGTGGTGRYTQQFHSLQVDLVGRGREFHVQQMADTGTPGSVCNRGGRDFLTLGCNVSSLYEIWNFKLSIGGKLGGAVATAVFDPILVRDPGDDNRKLYTSEVYGNQYFGGQYHGCYRESYHGPFYWYNGNGSTTFRTDIFGNPDPNGALEQMVSAHSFTNYTGSADGNTQFKRKASQCAPGLGLVN